MGTEKIGSTHSFEENAWNGLIPQGLPGGLVIAIPLRTRTG
jgi:hypothetical protein